MVGRGKARVVDRAACRPFQCFWFRQCTPRYGGAWHGAVGHGGAGLGEAWLGEVRQGKGSG